VSISERRQRVDVVSSTFAEASTTQEKLSLGGALDRNQQGTARMAAAKLMATSTTDLLDEFERVLRSEGGQLFAAESVQERLRAQAREILGELAQELTAAASTDQRDQPVAPRDQRRRAVEPDAVPAAGELDPKEPVYAANLLFQTVIRHVIASVGDDPAVRQVGLIALALHEVLARAGRVATDSYVGSLLNQVEQARIEERRRISRELHDHIGHGIGVAQRDLELFEIYRLTDPDRALTRARTARRRLLETMETVRLAIGVLRLMEPTENLENGVNGSQVNGSQVNGSQVNGAQVNGSQVNGSQVNGARVNGSAVAPEPARTVEINGDEAWTPAGTIEDTFVIIREALRNAIAHADAARVLVRADITPDELRASVVDNGRGFDPATGRPGGNGLLSMRERAMLLGGSLTFDSLPGRGTRIELRVPLGGGRQ
jgi:signal transduction histidine kinase